MELYNLAEIIHILKEKEISLFTLEDFARIFNIKNENTLYKKIQRLEKKKIIKKLIKGKYYFVFNQPDDFLMANFLYYPSYISLESALSFYGIITGFPYRITSISIKKARKIIIDNKEFSYSKIKNDLYWGFEKKDKFLIAEPEKAFLDYFYFASKGLTNLDFDDFYLKTINKKKLLLYVSRFKEKKLLKIIEKIL